MGVIQFDKNGARLIVKATRETLRRPKAVVKPSGPPRPLAPTKYAVVSKEIRAATGTTMGAGTATLHVVAISPSGVPTRSSLGVDVPVLSGASSPIAVGRVIIIAVIDGAYHVITDFC